MRLTTAEMSVKPDRFAGVLYREHYVGTVDFPCEIAVPLDSNASVDTGGVTAECAKPRRGLKTVSTNSCTLRVRPSPPLPLLHLPHSVPLPLSLLPPPSLPSPPHPSPGHCPPPSTTTTNRSAPGIHTRRTPATTASKTVNRDSPRSTGTKPAPVRRVIE